MFTLGYTGVVYINKHYISLARDFGFIVQTLISGFLSMGSWIGVNKVHPKEEVPCDSLSTDTREYFTRTNLDKIKNAPTDEP